MATKKKPPVAPRSTPRKVKNQMLPALQNGLTEAITGIGTPGFGTQLSQTDTLFKNNRWYLVSNMRQLLSEIYVEHGLIQSIVDVPVNDALRGGYEIKSGELSADEIEELLTHVDRFGINQHVFGQAMKWNRLFGGAAILIITDQDPSMPLQIDAIGEDSKLDFKAIDMWELYYDKQNSEGVSLTGAEVEKEHYNYYGIQVHRSRVLRMQGLTAPSFIRPRLRGWGFSIVESLVRAVNQYLKSNDLSFEVLDEFKLDIFKIKNLSQTLLSADGTATIQRRIALANYQKSYQNALTMDAEDDFVQKQLTWSGIAEMMKEFRVQIASDMRMPMTKLFGISSTGFNSGEDDIENYNAMVEGEVRAKCKYEIITCLELLCQQKFGYIPEDLSIDFKPLRVLSTEQEENVKNSRFNRVMQARQAGEITSLELREAINKDDLLPVQLDTSDAVLSELEADMADDAAVEGEDGEVGKPKVAPSDSRAQPEKSNAPKDPPREDKKGK